ncbi:DNA-binding domain-containing protein [Paraferrimonas haliotis]|uniref:HvfC family RiPP maturation protein n=1 Tax=Paraferrimonas haliotis TaxID=2013866 RepID=UPI000BA9389D|nr:putative DNA-binding domain-containing protein [Paraferrimonas haliotis]
MVDFKDVQQEFMASIRDPDNAPMPQGVSARRMKVYQELFFNNVRGFVDAAFPVLRSLFTQDAWLALQRRFFIEHDCQSPFFLDISQEFINYLIEHPQHLPQRFGFALELAHYEWLELKVSSSMGVESQRLTEQQVYQGSALLCVHHAVAVAQYQWPVQRISQEFIPDAPLDAPIFIALYRDEEDDVGFMQLDGLSAQLISFLQQQPNQTREQLQTWALSLFKDYPEQTLIEGLERLLLQLASLGIVRGLLGSSSD